MTLRFKWYDVRCDKNNDSKFRTYQTSKHIIVMQFLKELNAEDRKLCTKSETVHLGATPVVPTLFSQGFQQITTNAQ